jgi:signal transduction histidine kinase
VEALGGTLAAENRPEGGFALEIVLPIETPTGTEAE